MEEPLTTYEIPISIVIWFVSSYKVLFVLLISWELKDKFLIFYCVVLIWEEVIVLGTVACSFTGVLLFLLIIGNSIAPILIGSNRPLSIPSWINASYILCGWLSLYESLIIA